MNAKVRFRARAAETKAFSRRMQFQSNGLRFRRTRYANAGDHSLSAAVGPDLIIDQGDLKLGMAAELSPERRQLPTLGQLIQIEVASVNLEVELLSRVPKIELAGGIE